MSWFQVLAIFWPEEMRRHTRGRALKEILGSLLLFRQRLLLFFIGDPLCWVMDGRSTLLVSWTGGGADSVGTGLRTSEAWVEGKLLVFGRIVAIVA